MFVLRFFSVLLLVVSSRGDILEEIELKPGSEVKLTPDLGEGYHESNWTIRGCDGCKIFVGCVILSTSCDDHRLTLSNGKEIVTYCGEENKYAKMEAVDGKIAVDIFTYNSKLGSYCKAQSSEPFLNDVMEDIDSSEYGKELGNRTTSCECGWTNKAGSRIVGGVEATENEYPFAVLIGMRKKVSYFCGGSIITNKHVLTAAHCTEPYSAKKLSVSIGEHDTRQTSSDTRQIIPVEEIIEHSDYDDYRSIYDISILLLTTEIQFSAKVGPVCLPSVSKDLLNQHVKVMGWGHTMTNGIGSPILRKVSLKVIDWDNCRILYRIAKSMRNTQICTWAANKDSCQGDSGGPVVWLDPETNRYTQIGAISYGKACASTDPGVNTDIYHFMDWIKQTIDEFGGGNVCTASA